jgi:hypothetical protein
MLLRLILHKQLLLTLLLWLRGRSGITILMLLLLLLQV